MTQLKESETYFINTKIGTKIVRIKDAKIKCQEFNFATFNSKDICLFFIELFNYEKYNLMSFCIMRDLIDSITKKNNKSAIIIEAYTLIDDINLISFYVVESKHYLLWDNITNKLIEAKTDNLDFKDSCLIALDFIRKPRKKLNCKSFDVYQMTETLKKLINNITTIHNPPEYTHRFGRIEVKLQISEKETHLVFYSRTHKKIYEHLLY